MKAQLGVQVYWHTSGSAEDVRTAADRVLNYIVGLGANSVGLTFPIYTDGVHPTRVYTVSGSTPDPASLGIVITEAAARGLRITLRPLIDEANIKDAQGDWRGTIQPRRRPRRAGAVRRARASCRPGRGRWPARRARAGGAW